MRKNGNKKIILIILFFMLILVCLIFWWLYYYYFSTKLITNKIEFLNYNVLDDVLEVKIFLPDEKINTKRYCYVKDIDNKVLVKDNVCVIKTNHNNKIIIVGNNYGKTVKVDISNYINSVLFFEIDKEKIYLAINGVDKIGYSIKSLEDNLEINYKVLDSSIVSVTTDGIVKGIKAGETKVIVSIEDKIREVDVVVTPLIMKKPKIFNYKKRLLSCNNYSYKEEKLLDEILENRVSEVGYKTRAGVVESARFITLEFPYIISYFPENGRIDHFGINNYVDGEGRFYHQGLFLTSKKFNLLEKTKYGPSAWGCSLYSHFKEKIMVNGLDCSGFISWVLLNGGFDVGDIGAGPSKNIVDLTDLGEMVSLNKNTISKIQVGDLLNDDYGGGETHAAIVVGIDDNHYYVAESLWWTPYFGVVISNFNEQKFIKNYDNVILMDSFYKESGNLTNMWY